MKNQPSQTGRTLVLSALLCIAALQFFIFILNWRVYAVGEPGGFAVFYSTVLLVQQHGISHIYDPALQNAFHPLSVSCHAYWYHLSYEIYLLWPLGYLSRAAAFIVWTIFNLACVIAGCWIFLGRQLRMRRWELLLGVGTFAPLLLMCVNAQDSGLLFLFFAIAFDLWTREKEFPAGIALALSLFKFQYAILVVAILGWKHRRLLVGFVSVAVPLLAISFLPLGLQGWRDFLTLAHSDHYETGLMMANLRGLIYTTFGKDVFWLTVALSGLLFAYAAWMASRSHDRSTTFAAAVLTAWLLGYHGHFYDALLLVIPIALAMNRAQWPAILVFCLPLSLFRPLSICWVSLPLFYLLYELACGGNNSRASYSLVSPAEETAVR